MRCFDRPRGRGPGSAGRPDHRAGAGAARQTGASRAIVHEHRAAGDRSRAARSGSAACGAHRRRTPRASDGERALHLRGSIIVKFKDDATRGAAAAATAQVSGDVPRPIVVRQLRRHRHPGQPSIRRPPPPRCARGRTSSTRSRAISITRWRGPTTRSTSTSGTSPPSTWSVRGTSSPAPSSDIIVAVLDSGMAFRDITVRYNSRFRFA